MEDTVLDVSAIRRDFPILEREMRGRPLVYFDNAATSLKPQAVLDAERAYYTDYGANIHRGVYQFSEEASELYDGTREKIAKMVRAPESHVVVFTRGATESLNIVALGWGRSRLKPGDEIVITDVEHHANFVPWQMLAEKTGAVLRYLELDPESDEIDKKEADRLIGPKTKVVAATGMSNVTGYMPPVTELFRRGRSVGAITVLDAAQLASHHRLDLSDGLVDFVSFSSHKMCGPTGVGVLVGSKALLDTMEPLIYGGDMILRVKKSGTTFKGAPDRFEAGTPNIAGVFGLSAAVDYLEGIGLDAVAAHERRLLAYAEERATAVEDLIRYGAKDLSKRGGIFSFNVAEVHSHDVGTILDSEGIAVRTGMHCAHPYMQVMGIPGTTRASFYLYNTIEEVDKLFEAIDRVRRVFR